MISVRGGKTDPPECATPPAGAFWGGVDMTGLSQLLQTGLTGLSAAAEGMQTVASNTANVNTPGYNVQSLNQTELPGLDDGPGGGTAVTSVQRAFSQFVYQDVVQATSANGAAQVLQN